MYIYIYIRYKTLYYISCMDTWIQNSHSIGCCCADKFPGAGGAGGRSGGHCHRVVQTPVSCHHRSEGRHSGGDPWGRRVGQKVGYHQIML